MKRSGLKLIAHFLRVYTRRSVLIVALSILAGFAEGIGIVSLLPLLELASETSGSRSGIATAMGRALEGVGLAPSLGVFLTLIVLGMVLKGAFLWLASQQIGYAVAHVATDLRLALIRALLQARWGYFVGQRTGHISNAIGAEANRASSTYAAACSLLAVAVQVVVYAGAAFLVSPTVALSALAVGAVLAFGFRGLVDATERAGKRQTALIKSLSARLVDALNGLKPIKAMAQEHQLQPLLEGEIRELNQAQRRQVLAAGTMTAVHEPLLVLVIAVGLYVALAVLGMQLSSLLVVVFLFHRLVGRLHEVQTRYQTLLAAESAFWSVDESVRQAKVAREAARGKVVPPALAREIELLDVHFHYGDAPLLTGITLTIPAGKFVTIIGPSGVGKTTIADLVIGLFRPQEGEVYVDGVPLASIDLLAWRKTIGYVPQEMMLFHDSVYRNVTLGDDTVSRQAVMTALEEAGAAEFVADLPAGLDTLVGERGARLSGGQRQRIAIARALVRRPKLLVLDEVTTALDPDTEAAICDTLRALSGKVTILSISHQVAMSRIADVVYRLEPGGIVQQSISASNG